MSDIASDVVGGAAPVADVQPDSVQSFSFEDAHAKALAMWEGTPSGEAAVEQPEPVVEAAADLVSPDATNVDNASAAQLAQLSDDQLVEVTVDGEQVQMTWKEARAGVQRQAHYTKNMQALRQRETELGARDAEYQTATQQREALVTLLKDEGLLTQFLQKNFPHLLQQKQAIADAAAATDPNDIATVGQLQQLEQQRLQAEQEMLENFRSELRNELITATTQLETAAETTKLANSINTTISEIFTSHPYLKDIVPNAEQNLRYEVLQLQPRTPEETLQAFKQVAEGWVETFNKTVEQKTKQSVLTKQKLVKNNIQPPGGAQVQPQPTNFKRTHPMTGKQEVDWSALNKVAMSLFDK